MGDVNRIHKAGGIKQITLYAPEAKVLVVDDNTINLNVACGLLQLCGITAETAISGRQAFQMISQNNYDLVFMDHMMPELDGVETTKILRASGITIPIIALTANAISGVKDEFLAVGMNDLLTKPIDKTLLNNILIDWLPKEKLVKTQGIIPGATGSLTGKAEEQVGELAGFWQRVEQIKGLSVQTGLNMVFGQRDVYEKSLKLTIKEIEKCEKNLKDFLSDKDMRSFSVEVHSIKGSLASIGAVELSSLALKLENAADKEDLNFCIINLPVFLNKLNVLQFALVEAFAEDTQSQSDRLKIPPELSSTLSFIFEKLKKAFNETDFLAINEGIESLNSLNLEGALKEEIEKIKDAVLIMDYDGARAVIFNISV